MAKKHGDLELDEDIPLEHLMLTLQKIGWALLILLLACALLGLLGPGPLSRATQRSESGGLLLSYNRFERRLMDTSLRVHLGAGDTIWFHRGYFEHAEIKRIEPPPLNATSTDEEIAYSFALDSAGPLDVDFEINLRNRTGIARGTLRAGDQVVSFRQVIFP